MNSLLLLIVLIPAIEIYLFIKIGAVVGAFNTVLLIFFTAFVGIYYARAEGLNTLNHGLKKMVKKADVLMENFAPTVMDRLEIGYETMKAINPKLVYASGSGFGRTGPHRDKLAMDLTVQAVSGVMSVTGEMDGPPLKAGAAFCDFMAGIHLYGGITTALFEREKTGEGRLVEISMEEAVYSSLSSNLGIVYTPHLVYTIEIPAATP